MLRYQSVRLALAALLTFFSSAILTGEVALGWHDRVPAWLWCLGHGMTVALTIRSSAADETLSLSRIFLAYYIVCKTGALLTSASFSVMPPFLFDSLDWFVYCTAFFYVFGNDYCYNLYRRNPMFGWFCNGLSYVSTVYSITVPVKMAAELSLNEMHVAMNTSSSADACSDPHQASAALINAAYWPIFLGILSSCGATLVMHTLRLNTGEWGADIVRGVANTFAWAAVCVPAVVGYELVTNHRSHALLGCVAPYQPSALAHIEADTLVATWLLANHTLEWAANHVFGGLPKSKEQGQAAKDAEGTDRAERIEAEKESKAPQKPQKEKKDD